MPPNQGSWQPEVGWGALDLTQALANRGNYELASVKEGSARFFRANSSTGSKATLAWELRGTWDGYPANGVFPVIYTVSDLDLSQYRADDLSAVPLPADPGHGGGPDAGDSNDNVEQVRTPSGGGQMIYKVSSESTVEALDSEPFAIAATEPLTPLVNPEVEPFSSTTSASGPVNCSTEVTITTTLRNKSGDLDAERATVSLGLSAGTELVSGGATQSVAGGTLTTNATSPQVSWIVRATSNGSKTVTIEGSGSTMGETFRDSEQTSFTANCTPPNTSIVAGPEGATNDTTPSFSFSATEPADYECSLDRGAFSPCSSDYTAPALAEGSHVLSVRATDQLGNTDSSPASRSFTVDTTPPETSFTTTPDDPTRDKTPTFSFSASEPGSSFRCALDGDPFSACEPTTTFGPFRQTTKKLRVRAIDPAGNADPSPASRTFTIDRKVLDADLTAKKKQRQKGKKIKVKLKASAQERVTVRAKGMVKLPGRDARLEPTTKKFGAGKAKVLRLLLKRKRDRSRVLKALAHGEKVRANPSARFTDQAGNRTSERRVVRLK